MASKHGNGQNAIKENPKSSQSAKEVVKVKLDGDIEFNIDGEDVDIKKLYRQDKGITEYVGQGVKIKFDKDEVTIEESNEDNEMLLPVNADTLQAENVYQDHEGDQSLENEHVDLQGGITIKLPKTLHHKVQNMCSRPWTVSRRLSNLPKTDSENMERICSDVYELAYTYRAEGDHKKDGDIFDVEESKVKDITIKVPISNSEKGDWYDYEALIFSGNTWKRTKATFFKEDGCNYVNFNANSINSFCISRTPYKERCIITKDGKIFTSDKDVRVQVTFPKDAVNDDEAMQFVLYPIDHVGMKWRLDNHPSNYNILAMSDCLFVNHSVPKFNTFLDVHLPISEELEDNELVFFCWKGDEYQIIDKLSAEHLEKTNERCTLSVDSFSGYSAGLIRSGSLESITRVEVELNRGFLKQCTILLFVKKSQPAYFSLWVEIVGRDKMEETVIKRTSEFQLIEIPLCRSSDVFLLDEQRIRIDVSGNVRFVNTKEKLARTLTFLHAAVDTYMSFPLEISRRMDTVPYSVVHFVEDSGKRRCLHIAHFDPDQVHATNKTIPKSFYYESPPSQIRDIFGHFPKLHRSTVQVDSNYKPGKMKSETTFQTGIQSSGIKSKTENKEFFTDQSMIVLALKLPTSQVYSFGILLGIQAETMDRLFIKARDDVQKFHFSVLKEWLTIEKSDDRLGVLMKALTDCQLYALASKLEVAFQNRRKLEMKDLE